MTTSKICTKCELTKELTEFYKRKDSPDGYRNDCKICCKARSLKNGIYYRENNVTKEKERHAKYHIENREEINRKYKIRTDRIRTSENVRISAWKKTEIGIVSGVISRAKRRAFELTGKNNNTKHENYLIRCIYTFSRFKTITTGIEHHVDHKHPFAKGGLHHPDNLQILTATENLQKGAKVA